MDELIRLRSRRDQFVRPDPDLAHGGTPRFLGKVTSTGSALGAGKFALVNPAIVLGQETEGSPATVAIDTAITVPVYQVDALATGDFVVCRFVDYRWVATKRLRGGTTPPMLVYIPGCFCQGTPLTLNLTVTYGPGETSATYGGYYQNSTLAYYSGGTDRPSYFTNGQFFGPGYYSIAPHAGTFPGSYAYFKLGCNSSQYVLGDSDNAGSQYPYQTAPGLLYTWAVGGNPAVNFCSPFGLYVGRTYPGRYFNGSFTVSG